MLGMGRAIGETIAVTILIGDAPQLGGHLFGQGYSLAAAIANEFGEAQGLHRSALFAAALVLFVLTLLVNGVSRHQWHGFRAAGRAARCLEANRERRPGGRRSRRGGGRMRASPGHGHSLQARGWMPRVGKRWIQPASADGTQKNGKRVILQPVGIDGRLCK